MYPSWKHEFVVFRKQILLIKTILAPLKLIGRVDATTWFECEFICIKCNITMVHDGRWRSTQDLKTTNFHRLPCTRKAQNARYLFHEIQVQGKLIA